MKFTYKIKGIELNMVEMSDICQYYKAACTAEYIVDNYGFSEDKALDAAYDIRRKMDKYDYTESEAIAEYISENPDCGAEVSGDDY